MAKRALILFAHGARDPRWAAPFERLRELAQGQLQDADVRLAFLELMTPQLPDLVAQLAQGGCADVTVVPVFLGQGGHVQRDLPQLLAQLRADHPQVTVRVAEAAGENPEVLNAIAAYCIAAMDGPAVQGK